MKYIRPMNCCEFSNLLLTMKNGDTIEFGTDTECSWPDETPDVDNVSGWYFARVIYITEYESRFILIDYCGGEQAFAIPLNCYKNECDEDDMRIVPEYIQRFFKNYLELNVIDDCVFVEMEDDEQ